MANGNSSESENQPVDPVDPVAPVPAEVDIADIAEMLDITAPKHGVDIEWREDGTVIWVNVDGICRLRICQIPQLWIKGVKYEPR